MTVKPDGCSCDTRVMQTLFLKTDSTSEISPNGLHLAPKLQHHQSAGCSYLDGKTCHCSPRQSRTTHDVEKSEARSPLAHTHSFILVFPHPVLLWHLRRVQHPIIVRMVRTVSASTALLLAASALTRSEAALQYKV